MGLCRDMLDVVDDLRTSEDCVRASFSVIAQDAIKFRTTKVKPKNIRAPRPHAQGIPKLHSLKARVRCKLLYVISPYGEVR